MHFFLLISVLVSVTELLPPENPEDKTYH